MAEWIEVPAHRIYVVSVIEAEKRFRRLNGDGEEIKPFEEVVIFLRDDGKRFKQAAFKPARDNLFGPHYHFFLEEIF